MAIISPTITTNNPSAYLDRMKLFNLAKIIHIDITDGVFAPSETINLNQILVGDSNKNVALHLMMNDPARWANQIVAINPRLVFIHAESDIDIAKKSSLIDHLHKFDIQVGIAFLAETNPVDHDALLKKSDAVLLFGGKLGYQGGQADLTVLDKIPAVKSIDSQIQIHYDGGASRDNLEVILSAGVDVVCMGSAISNTKDPAQTLNEFQDLADTLSV